MLDNSRTSNKVGFLKSNEAEETKVEMSAFVIDQELPNLKENPS